MGEVLIPESLVHIKASISEGLERPLPLTSLWGAMTDSVGIARFTIPAGDYRVSVQNIGWRSGEILVRATSRRLDTVHVWIDQQAVC